MMDYDVLVSLTEIPGRDFEECRQTSLYNRNIDKEDKRLKHILEKQLYRLTQAILSSISQQITFSALKRISESTVIILGVLHQTRSERRQT